MNNETAIEICNDTDNLPQITLDIIPLTQLAEKNASDLVDVIGVVKSTGDISTIVARATGKELTKRDVTLVDDSACSISCTLWGKQVIFFNYLINYRNALYYCILASEYF